VKYFFSYVHHGKLTSCDTGMRYVAGHRLRTGDILLISKAGFMGTAILQGLLRRSQDPNHTFAACVRSEESLSRLQRDLSEHSVRVELAPDLRSLLAWPRMPKSSFSAVRPPS
jgi:hypothetical protein